MANSSPVFYAFIDVMQLDTYTTDKNMEYLENTIETLVFDICFVGKGLAQTANKHCVFMQPSSVL